MTSETSRRAFATIADQLSPRRAEIFSILADHGELTATQVEVLIRSDKSPSRGSNVHARLSELREMGVVREAGSTACPISGMNVLLWSITGEIPQAVPKRLSAKTRIEHLSKALFIAVDCLRKTNDLELIQAFEHVLKEYA